MKLINWILILNRFFFFERAKIIVFFFSFEYGLCICADRQTDRQTDRRAKTRVNQIRGERRKKKEKMLPVEKVESFVFC